MPKFNLYQSLHTTVVGPEGKPVEFQIRTERDAPPRRVRRRRALGLQGAASTRPRTSSWLQRLVDWQQETDRPGRVHADAEDRPRAGRGLRLHAEGQGHHAADRRDAGRLRVRDPHRGRAPVHRRAGERPARAARLDAARRATRVEIFTSKVEGAGPSRDWLQFVQTPRARAKIRQWFSRERRVDAIDTGRDELVKALRREGLPVQKLACRAALAEGRRELQLRRPRGAATPRSARATSRRKAVVQRVQRELRGGEEQLPGHRAAPAARPRAGAARRACTSRASTTSWCGSHAAARRCPATRSWASSPAGAASRCTAPTARTPAGSRSQADRVIEVEWDHDAPGNLRRVGRDRGARPVAPAPRRRRRALGAPREHPLVHDPDAGRPRRPAPVRVRARRPRPPRLAAGRGQAGRLGLRGLPGPARHAGRHRQRRDRPPGRRGGPTA